MEYILEQIPVENNKSTNYEECLRDEKMTREYDHLSRLTQMYSATMPRNMTNLIKKHLRFPIEIEVTNKEKSRSNINHEFEYLAINSEMNNNKNKKLKELLKNMELQIIIFVARKYTCEVLSKELSNNRFKACSYHSGFEQKKREEVIQRFKNR